MTEASRRNGHAHRGRYPSSLLRRIASIQRKVLLNDRNGVVRADHQFMGVGSA